MSIGQRVQIYRNKETEAAGKVRVKTHTGTFQCWGLDYDDHDNGVGTFTVAIITQDDGTVTMEYPTNVQFLGPDLRSCDDKKS